MNIAEQNASPLPSPPKPPLLRWGVVVFTVVLAVVAAMIFFESRRESQPTSGTALVGDHFKGQLAPEFQLRDLSGKPVRLSELRGKAVIVNFWATWCPPCLAEMPWFNEMQTQYGSQGLAVVGINMDDDATPDSIEKFTNKLGITYTILLGKDDVAKQYGGVEVLPTTYYVGRDGRIVERNLGAPDRAEIEKNVKKILSQPAAVASQVSPKTVATGVVPNRESRLPAKEMSKKPKSAIGGAE